MSNSIYHYSKLHPGGSSLHNLENLKKYILLFLHSIDYLYQLSLIFQINDYHHEKETTY